MALLFKDERATKAVLSFLRKTRVGQMITIPPRDGEAEREEAEGKGRRGGQGPPHEKLIKEGAEGGGRLQGNSKVLGIGCLLVWWRFCFVVSFSLLGTAVRGGAPL